MYLGGLGTTFSDLPNGGRNVRLYTFDPPGSQFYNPQGNIYNTGHYDISLAGGPCSLADPQGFNDSAAMNAYAGGRGEMLVLVSRADLTALCAARPSVAPAPAPVMSPPTVTAPAGSSGTSTTLILRGGSSSNITQPGVFPPVQVISPSAGIDTGPQELPPVPYGGNPGLSDNTLMYAGLGLLAILILRR